MPAHKLGKYVSVRVRGNENKAVNENKAWKMKL
jgi:hypothetical protein